MNPFDMFGSAEEIAEARATARMAIIVQRNRTRDFFDELTDDQATVLANILQACSSSPQEAARYDGMMLAQVLKRDLCTCGKRMLDHDNPCED